MITLCGSTCRTFVSLSTKSGVEALSPKKMASGIRIFEKLCHECGAVMNGSDIFIKDPAGSPSFYCPVRTWREDTICGQEEDLTRTPPCRPRDLGLSASRIVRNKFLLFTSYPVSGTFNSSLKKQRHVVRTLTQDLTFQKILRIKYSVTSYRHYSVVMISQLYTFFNCFYFTFLLTYN